MSLAATLARLGAAREGVFMPFLVLGDPDPDTSLALASALIKGGADVLELGFPFSDPPADGPVIQAADQRALAAGMTPGACFALIDQLHGQHPAVPIALLIYYNLVLQFRGGVAGFYRRAAEVGVEAVLVADLPIEEADVALAAASAAGIAPIFIASELSSEARLARMLPAARGYLYVVAAPGVTGVRADLAPALSATLARLRTRTSLPLLAGFGISSPEQVAAVLAAGADGAIVGSALISEIERGDRGSLISRVEDRARALKAATRRPA